MEQKGEDLTIYIIHYFLYFRHHYFGHQNQTTCSFIKDGNFQNGTKACNCIKFCHLCSLLRLYDENISDSEVLNVCNICKEQYVIEMNNYNRIQLLYYNVRKLNFYNKIQQITFLKLFIFFASKNTDIRNDGSDVLEDFVIIANPKMNGEIKDKDILKEKFEELCYNYCNTVNKINSNSWKDRMGKLFSDKIDRHEKQNIQTNRDNNLMAKVKEMEKNI